MILETKRLFLRPWDESDAEELYKYASDPKVGPIAGWPVHTSVENSRQIIRDVLSAPETYAVVLKETMLPVGSIGLFKGETSLNDDELELGFWIGVPFWGQGLIPEASEEMLRHAFDDLKMSKVWCCYSDGNEKSKRAQEKIGFVFQTTNDSTYFPQINEVRKTYINCITKEDWQKKRKENAAANYYLNRTLDEIMSDNYDGEWKEVKGNEKDGR